jgi:hypothetical protein
MKKIVRLTENEMVSLITRVINEQQGCTKISTYATSKMKNEVPNTVVQKMKDKILKSITSTKGDSGGFKDKIVGEVMGNTKELESKLNYYASSLIDAKYGITSPLDFNKALYDVAEAVMSMALSTHDNSFMLKIFLDHNIDSKNQQQQSQNALKSFDLMLKNLFAQFGGFYGQVNMETGRWAMKNNLNDNAYCRTNPWVNQTSEDSFISGMGWWRQKLMDTIQSHV